MATNLHWSQAPIPDPSDDNLASTFMAAFGAGIDPKLVHSATSQGDRDTRFSDLPAGSIVSCAALSTIWLKTQTSPAAWAKVYQDTGWVTSVFSYPLADWNPPTPTDVRIRNRNGVIDLRAIIRYTGADITSSAGTGNILGDPNIMIIPAEYWPAQTLNFCCGLRDLGGYFTLDTSGRLRLKSVAPTVVVDSGTDAEIHHTWISET